MNVLSLFDGMSCGQIALNRIGLKPAKYYAAEIDKYAVQVTQANWPETVQLGDVTKWQEWDVDWKGIDLLIGGSPCQGFSFAGKQLAFDDPRSKLFFVYVDILKHIRALNPDVKFMLENVRMKKEYLEVISEQLGVEPVFINSNLVSAQNRQRFYWANWKIEQPKDKGILLADILENDFVDRDKSHCLDANYYKGGNPKSYFEKRRRQLVFINQIPRGNNPGGIRAIDGKVPTLSANSWEQNNHLVTGKSTVVGMASDRFGHDMTRRIYSPQGKSPTLLAMSTGGAIPPKVQTAESNKYTEFLSYRKLTPIECERLQTVPDQYTNHVSNTQRYKMLGNGWTVDVITHIFSTMQSTEVLPIKTDQLDMFGSEIA